MEFKIGNLFETKAKTLVNTVNCVGVMGKGIALDFKKKYPDMYNEYEQRCVRHEVKPGQPYYYTDLLGTSIINFPTKDHWRSPSRLSYIETGLDWFRDNYEKLGIRSVAFPPLGCGNGGLTWDTVGPLMYAKLSDLPVDIEVYAPFGTDPAHLTESFLSREASRLPAEAVGKKQASMNQAWLLILYVIQRLNNSRYSLNVGRTIYQKVCYVLTRTGIPTGFHFVRGSYGPYSKEAKDSVAVLSNANLMTEKQFGKMIVTVVDPEFRLPEDTFSPDDLRRAEQAVDLLSRIKSTDHAELITTVLFSYDELSSVHDVVTDKDVFQDVLNWKKKYVGEREVDVCRAIEDLAALGWMTPVHTGELLYRDDDLF